MDRGERGPNLTSNSLSCFDDKFKQPLTSQTMLISKVVVSALHESRESSCHPHLTSQNNAVLTGGGGGGIANMARVAKVFPYASNHAAITEEERPGANLPKHYHGLSGPSFP